MYVIGEIVKLSGDMIWNLLMLIRKTTKIYVSTYMCRLSNDEISDLSKIIKMKLEILCRHYGLMLIVEYPLPLNYKTRSPLAVSLTLETVPINKHICAELYLYHKVD